MHTTYTLRIEQYVATNKRPIVWDVSQFVYSLVLAIIEFIAICYMYMCMYICMFI